MAHHVPLVYCCRRLLGHVPDAAAESWDGQQPGRELQAWIAGPNEHGEAYMLLTNLGPNLGDGGYVTVGGGEQKVSVTLADLGLGGSVYRATDVWYGNVTTFKRRGSLSATLGEGESKFLRLTPV